MMGRHLEERRTVHVTATTWTCWRCFRPIGEVRGNRVTIKRRGSEIVACLPCSQTCPHCRTLCLMDALAKEEEAKQT